MTTPQRTLSMARNSPDAGRAPVRQIFILPMVARQRQTGQCHTVNVMSVYVSPPYLLHTINLSGSHKIRGYTDRRWIAGDPHNVPQALPSIGNVRFGRVHLVDFKRLNKLDDILCLCICQYENIDKKDLSYMILRMHRLSCGDSFDHAKVSGIFSNREYTPKGHGITKNPNKYSQCFPK